MQAYEYYEKAGISREVYELAQRAISELSTRYLQFERNAELRELEVIAAFQGAGVSEACFLPKTGYGYNDIGREAVDAVFAKALFAERAMVRIQFSSGTHVLATMLKSVLGYGDDLLIASGEPYDTLLPALGELEIIGQTTRKYNTSRQSLKGRGVSVRAMPLSTDGKLDVSGVLASLKPHTKAVYVQKSRGYTLREAFTTDDIAKLVKALKAKRPEILVLVDNCYGEFVEATEPTAVGADLMAGSLIKNPGAGIAPSGAYVAGKPALVEQVAEEMTSVGVGSEIGPNLGFARALLRGIYLAPRIVCNSLKNAALAAKMFELSGYETSPASEANRGDIVQCLILRDRQKLIDFCQGVQQGSLIDSCYLPVPSPMPGYDSDIIMASGSFVQGSSIEISADGPLREPYVAYLQGGMTEVSARLALLKGFTRFLQQK